MHLRNPGLSTIDDRTKIIVNAKSKHEIPFEDIDGLQENTFRIILGRGSHSTVYKGKYLSNEVAIKRLKKDKSGFYPSENQISHLLKDVISEEKISDSHITPFYGCALHESEEFLVYALMFCTLEEWIENKNNYHGLNYQLMGHVAYALRLVHRFAIHCDIKPDNIFIKKNGFQVEALLGDFSLSRIKDSYTRHTKAVGSLLYSAPEILRREKINSEETDIYSLGLVFYYAATSISPYLNYTNETSFINAVGHNGLALYKNENAESQSPKLMAMSAWCVSLPSKRPTSDQLVKEFSTTRHVLSENLSIFAQGFKRAIHDEAARQKTRELLPGCIM